MSKLNTLEKTLKEIKDAQNDLHNKIINDEISKYENELQEINKFLLLAKMSGSIVSFKVSVETSEMDINGNANKVSAEYVLNDPWRLEKVMELEKRGLISVLDKLHESVIGEKESSADEYDMYDEEEDDREDEDDDEHPEWS